MAKFRDKLRVIRRVICSEECVLIYRKNNGVLYDSATDSIFFFDLFQSIHKYVPKWYGAWLTNNNKK